MLHSALGVHFYKKPTGFYSKENLINYRNHNIKQNFIIFLRSECTADRQNINYYYSFKFGT